MPTVYPSWAAARLALAPACAFSSAAIWAGDRSRFSERASRAHAVIVELSATLDRERGGEIARSLERLYDFMLRQLTLAPSAGDADAVTMVRQLLDTIRVGFDGAVKESAGARPA